MFFHTLFMQGEGIIGEESFLKNATCRYLGSLSIGAFWQSASAFR